MNYKSLIINPFCCFIKKNKHKLNSSCRYHYTCLSGPEQDNLHLTNRSTGSFLLGESFKDLWYQTEAICIVWTHRKDLTPRKNFQPVHPKRNQSWIFIGRTDAEAETPILQPPDGKKWLVWKDPDAGKDWRQEEKGTTEDEMVGWHHWLDGHEFE